MYDLHNQILLKENFEVLEHFRLNGLGVVFKNSFNSARNLSWLDRAYSKAFTYHLNIEMPAAGDRQASHSAP